MSDIEQKAAALQKSAAAAEEKAALEVTQEVGQAAVKARQKSVAALNRGESWIAAHPGRVTLIALGLFAAAFAVLSRACS